MVLCVCGLGLVFFGFFFFVLFYVDVLRAHPSSRRRAATFHFLAANAVPEFLLASRLWGSLGGVIDRPRSFYAFGPRDGVIYLARVYHLAHICLPRLFLVFQSLPTLRRKHILLFSLRGGF